MNEREAVHTLARRYCQEQFREWSRRYAEIQRSQSRRAGDYSPEAYDAFPRYLILQAILRSIEALRPESADTVNSLVDAMTVAARDAQNNLTAEPRNAIAGKAIADERAKFFAYVRSLTAEPISWPAPLPFRRTLTKAESDRFWIELQGKWGIDGEYWYPLRSTDLPRGMLSFHTDYFDTAKEALLRELLTRRGIARIWELREGHADECELEIVLFEPHYNGAEGYWTSGGSDWLVYASHESSITLAGDWLVPGFKEMVPDCERYRYGGPFSTSDLRGTWKWSDAD